MLKFLASPMWMLLEATKNVIHVAAENGVFFFFWKNNIILLIIIKNRANLFIFLEE